MPPSSTASNRRPRAAINSENAFWYEGAAQGELRVQMCADCQQLRHPPLPMCARCNSRNRTWIVASGRGEIYSYVVHHHPPVRGMDTPFVVLVVELEEGIRVVGNLVDGREAPFDIGTPVEAVFVADPGDDRVLPQWRIAR
jgi:uncharacterized OB-fold protein